MPDKHVKAPAPEALAVWAFSSRTGIHDIDYQTHQHEKLCNKWQSQNDEQRSDDLWEVQKSRLAEYVTPLPIPRAARTDGLPL